MEEVVQGYCRVLDAARSVWLEDGEADCAFPNCAYQGDCPIAKKLSTILEEAENL